MNSLQHEKVTLVFLTLCVTTVLAQDFDVFQLSVWISKSKVNNAV